MELAEFVMELRSSQTVRLMAASAPTGLRSSQLAVELGDLYLEAALACPGEAPELDLGAAVEGARLTCEACRFLAFRELGEAELAMALAVPAGLDRESPAVAFSLDLTMRCLPDLQRLARAAATADPLVGRLAALGRWAPLSSVGMTLDGVVLPATLLADAALAGLYVERVVAARAWERLTDPRLLSLAREAIGGGVAGDERLREELEACG